jgi:hypothetical protein
MQHMACKSVEHVPTISMQQPMPAHLGTKVGSAANVGAAAASAADAAGLLFKRILRALTGSGGAGLDTTLLLALLLLLLLLLHLTNVL